MLKLRVRAGLGRWGLGKGGRGKECANSAGFGWGLRLKKRDEERREGKDWRENRARDRFRLREKRKKRCEGEAVTLVTFDGLEGGYRLGEGEENMKKNLMRLGLNLLGLRFKAWEGYVCVEAGEEGGACDSEIVGKGSCGM